MDVNALDLKRSTLTAMVSFHLQFAGEQAHNNENALCDCTMHYLLPLYWTLVHHKKHFPLMCAATSARLHSLCHPGLNLWKISPLFVPHGASAWCRECSKSYFSSGNCKWSACLKSSFICHPMKHSQIPSVNYCAINYYLQTSMKYVHSLQNKSTPAWLFFMIRCAANACLSLLWNRRGVQTNCGWWGSVMAALKENMLFSTKQRRTGRTGKKLGYFHCLAQWFSESLLLNTTLSPPPSFSSSEVWDDLKTFLPQLQLIHHVCV